MSILGYLTKYFFFILLVSLGVSFHQVNAQDNQPREFSGKIKALDNDEPVPYTNIIIINRGLGTSADFYGNFSIFIRPGDSLRFTSVGYIPQVVNFADSVFNKDFKDQVVYLKRATQDLDTVTIKAYDIQAILEADRVRKVDLERDRNPFDYQVRDRVERATVRLGYNPEGGMALQGVLTALANQFNSRYKQQKKLKEIKKEEDERQWVNAMYDFYYDMASYVLDLYGEPLRRFVDATIPPPYIIEATSDYNLIVFILDSYEQIFPYEKRKVNPEKILKNAQFYIED